MRGVALATLLLVARAASQETALQGDTAAILTRTSQIVHNISTTQQYDLNTSNLGNERDSTLEEETTSRDGFKIFTEESVTEGVPGNNNLKAITDEESSRMMKEDEDRESQVPSDHSLVADDVGISQTKETESDSTTVQGGHSLEEVNLTQAVPGAQSVSPIEGGAKFRCPNGCMCSEDAEVQVQCSVGDNVITIAHSGDNYSVQCQQQSFDVMMYEDLPANFTDYIQKPSSPQTVSCSDLPSLSLPQSARASSLSIAQCPLSLQCVQSALGVARVRALTLSDGSWPSFDTAHEIQELSVLHHRPANLTLPVQSLSSLPLLHTLTVRGVSLSLSGALPALALSRLELAQCGLTTLPARLFIHLKGLQHLYLHGNQLHTVDDDVLQGLSSLVTLGLSSNRLSRLPTAGLAAHCPQLQVLSAFSNEIAVLDNMSNLTELTELEVFYNRAPLTLAAAALANLPRLKAVDLRDCGIKALPAALLANTSSLQHLNLANNDIQDIPHGFLRDQVSLVSLELSGNALQSLRQDALSALRALRRLALDGNQLTNVDSALSVPLPALLSLSLSHNRLADISRPALTQCAQLQDLQLAHNHITSYWIYPGVMDNIDYLFNTLRLLRTLDLSYNNISLAPSGSNAPLSLAHLNVSHNAITNVTDISYLTEDVTVDLTHNRIASLYLTAAGAGAGGARAAQPRNVLLLDHNPFTCDCFMYNVVTRLRGRGRGRDHVALDVGNATCAAPAGLRGTRVLHVREEELYCRTDSAECVDSCHCNVRPYNSALEVVCRRLPDTLPREDHFGVSRTELQLLQPPHTYNNDTQVQLLNLSSLALTRLPRGQPGAALKLLDLTNNSLTQIPVQLLADNSSVLLLLRMNPFQCECWNQRDVALLQARGRRVGDYDNVTCAGGDYVRAVSVAQLCVRHYAAAVGGTLLVIGLFVALTALLYVCYRVEVQILLTRYGLIKRAEELDDKQYDAFVSYAFEDEQFVLEQLIPRLERDEGLALCVHARDWLPGDWIATAIATSVRDSRRTVVLLSNNFINSRWARLEVQTAIAAALDNTTKLVVILLDDVTRHPDLEPELKAYLKTNTYVRWGDPWFWRKLLHALPKRRDTAIRPPARSVCPVPSDVLMTKVATSDVHPADVIMAANNGHTRSGGINNTPNALNDVTNDKGNAANGVNGRHGVPRGGGLGALTQDELCHQLNNKLTHK